MAGLVVHLAMEAILMPFWTAVRPLMPAASVWHLPTMTSADRGSSGLAGWQWIWEPTRCRMASSQTGLKSRDVLSLEAASSFCRIGRPGSECILEFTRLFARRQIGRAHG